MQAPSVAAGLSIRLPVPAGRGAMQMPLLFFKRTPHSVLFPEGVRLAEMFDLRAQKKKMYLRPPQVSRW